MTRRIQPIITNQIYHVFNRGIAGQPIFSSIYDYQRFTDLVYYYRFLSPDLRYSFYKRLSIGEKQKYLTNLKNNKSLQVQIYAYSLMPNHYHLLVKEIYENGIRKFFANIQNSYAKYYNTRKKRKGSLFTEMFKTVRIEDDEQFVHVARYIHLNPLTSYILKNIQELENYHWSSYPCYIGKAECEFLNIDKLLGYYKNTEELIKFTLDQVDYQRTIHNLSYLAPE